MLSRTTQTPSLTDREARLAAWMLGPTVIVVSALVIFPVVWNLFLSLKTIALADLRGPGLFDFDLTLDNFRKAFFDYDFWPSLLTTIAYTLGGSLLSIAFGLTAALLVHGEFRGRGVLRGLFVIPYVAPIVAATFAWSFILDPQLGVLNWFGLKQGIISQPIPFFSQKWFPIQVLGTQIRLPLALLSVIFFEGWRYFPFAFLFILSRLQAIPDEIYQAAAVDGAGPIQRFLHMTLPQLKTVLSTLFLFRFVWTLNKFDDIFLLTRGQAGTKVLSIKVYDYAFGEFDLGASSAVAMILFFVLALFLMIYFLWMVQEDESIYQ